MTDYANALGRVAELIVENTREAFQEVVRLVRPHAPTPAVGDQLDAMTAPEPEVAEPEPEAAEPEAAPEGERQP